MLTRELIPTKGVYISENYHPPGFFVAHYDADGFVSGSRYFGTLTEAKTYADKLKAREMAR